MSQREYALRQFLERLNQNQHIEQVLREQQRILITLLDNLPGMVYRCRNDPGWTMEFVSDGCLELTGYPVADLVDSRVVSYASLIHPADRAEVYKQVEAAVGQRQPFRLTYRIRTAAGEERWVFEQGRGVFANQSQLQALEGFITDITERKQTEELLQLSEARYRAIVENQTDLLCRFLSDGTLTFVNDAYCRYFGRSHEALLGTRFLPMIPDEDQDSALAQTAACTAEHPINTYIHRVIRADGEWRWMQWTDQAILDENQALLELQSVGRDITDQRRAEEALRESEARYRRIVETAQEGIWQIDAEGRTTFANTRMAEMLGCTVAAMQGKSLFDFMDEEGRRIAEANLERRRQGIAEQHDFKFRRLDGGELWALLATNPITDAQGRYAGALAMVTDITDRKRMENTLRQLATQDSLTGLFNRRHFFSLAQQEFERSQRYRHPLSLLMLDLDYFKAINDTYGHQLGDQVLQAVAGVIRAGLRQIDIACRYGGEEFVVLLPETAPATALSVAQRVCAALVTTPVATAQGAVSVTVSIGVAALTDHEPLTLDDLLERADRALYAAKAAGRNRVELWSPAH